jgi:ubiquinone/menaquinone biosynthesis C-methylase UbiE
MKKRMMTQPPRDIWSDWVLERRFGGNRDVMKAALDDYFYPVRDKVLQNAVPASNPLQVLLDVGCGDGLIAFGALEKFPAGKVIFSDVSQSLLNHSHSIAGKMNVIDRCEFVLSPAEKLAIQSASVDAVTACCVLIHVADKQSAFNEFFRVLKPGGRMSIFEPVNRFSLREGEHLFCGFDVTPVSAIAAKVKDVYLKNQPLSTDPMLNFDERDLVDFSEKAGFPSIQLEFQIKVERPTVSDWEALVRRPPNPRAPSLEEAIKQALTPEEAELFVSHLRPLVESKQGIKKSAVAYLSATKL